MAGLQAESTSVSSGVPSAPDGAELGVSCVCPAFHAAIELVGRRWAGAILWCLATEPRYFAEIKRSAPGLSDRLLSCRLRELEAAGIVERTVHDEQPARVSYSLTPMGHELRPAMESLQEWARRWDVA